MSAESDARLILANLRERGIRVWLEASGKPLLDPKSALSDYDWLEVKENRAAIIEILWEEGTRQETHEEPPAEITLQPTIPPGARVFLCNAKCQECGPGEEVYMWTYEGAPQWYYPPKYPPPYQPEGRKKRRVPEVTPSESLV